MFQDVKVKNLIQLLNPYKGLWWFAGGWGVDFHVGYQTREHEDIDLAIPKLDIAQFRKFLGKNTQWQFARNRQIHEWEIDAGLEPAIFELHLQHTQVGDLEVLLLDFDKFDYVFRHDDKIRLTTSGFKFDPPAPLPAEILLLFKSKETREKDRHDFDILYPHLNTGQKTWLYNSIKKAFPQHEWLKKLAV